MWQVLCEPMWRIYLSPLFWMEIEWTRADGVSCRETENEKLVRKLEGSFMKTWSRNCFRCVANQCGTRDVRPGSAFGPVNFVVLRVTFSDFGTGTRFNASATQANLANIATLWAPSRHTETSHSNIKLPDPIRWLGKHGLPGPAERTVFINVGHRSAHQGRRGGSPKTINWRTFTGS